MPGCNICLDNNKNTGPVCVGKNCSLRVCSGCRNQTRKAQKSGGARRGCPQCSKDTLNNVEKKRLQGAVTALLNTWYKLENFKHPKYQQPKEEFVPNLSVLDILFSFKNNKCCDIIRSGYTIIIKLN